MCHAVARCYFSLPDRKQVDSESPRCRKLAPPPDQADWQLGRWQTVRRLRVCVIFRGVCCASSPPKPHKVVLWSGGSVNDCASLHVGPGGNRQQASTHLVGIGPQSWQADAFIK